MLSATPRHSTLKRNSSTLERLFRLRIRDDGKGIEPGMLKDGRAGHYGLDGMRERCRQIGAEFTIWSGVGAGTRIELSIPGSIAYRPFERRRFRWFRGGRVNSPSV